MSLTVVIPSRTEIYLQRTLDDLLRNARGAVEVVVVLDGYWPKEYDWSDPRVKVVHQGAAGASRGMRAAINQGMALSSGDYVMKCDEHCAFAPGYDLALKSDCRPDWVVIPRRKRLDPEKWAVIEDGRPPVDYMLLENKDGYLHGAEWKRPERDALLLDETPTGQGSCYFMPRAFWESTIGPLNDANYGSFANEAQEVTLKAWLSGGAVMVNKRTWYAHWHRQGGYNFTPEEQKAYRDSITAGRAYCHRLWTNDGWPLQRQPFKWLAEHFPDAK